MSAYVDECEACDRCVGCSRRVCFREEVSPGEVDGLCLTCWETDDDNQGETE